MVINPDSAFNGGFFKVSLPSERVLCPAPVPIADIEPIASGRDVVSRRLSVLPTEVPFPSSDLAP